MTTFFWTGLCLLGLAIGSSRANTHADLIVIFETEQYADEVIEHVRSLLPQDAPKISVCSQPWNCTISEEWDDVIGVVGNVPADLYPKMSKLRLTQSASDMYARPDSVPANVFVARYAAGYADIDVGTCAEFIIASAFDWQYRLAEKSRAFSECAWAADSPKSCPPASALANHATLMSKTLGILGYGQIGQAVAKRSLALGMRTIATKAHPPFTTDLNMAWLGNDNDRLFRESDFVAVLVPGHLRNLVNKTSIELMKPGAVIIPLSAGPIDYEALRIAAMEKRVGAVLESWDEGCWHYPGGTCGPPFGRSSWPHHVKMDGMANNNVRAVPGMAMRDSRFWSGSARFVAENIAALVRGVPLKGVIRRNRETVLYS